jgi:hypothetical protein
MAVKKERRRAPRTPSNASLDIYDAKGQTIIGEGSFGNVSMTGGLLITRTKLRMRQEIILHVPPAKNSPLKIHGRVVWQSKSKAGFAYGIQFITSKSKRAR